MDRAALKIAPSEAFSLTATIRQSAKHGPRIWSGRQRKNPPKKKHEKKSGLWRIWPFGGLFEQQRKAGADECTDDQLKKSGGDRGPLRTRLDGRANGAKAWHKPQILSPLAKPAGTACKPNPDGSKSGCFFDGSVQLS